MTRALLMIRRDPCYRREAFEAGLRACGYEIHGAPRGGAIGPGDVLVLWNRYGHYHAMASMAEQAGARVIIAENGPLGREWRGGHWYTVVGGNPAGGGWWRQPDPGRWDSLGAEICEWRKGGREVIILGQRGIGPPGIRQPDGWHREVAARFHLDRLGPVRIREHPGERVAVPLEQDLADALCVVTWSSAAAIKALHWGIPVLYGFEKWVMKDAATPLRVMTEADAQRAPESLRRERLPAFRALAWTMFATHEIAAGVPFRSLLASPSGISSSTIEAR